MPPSASDALLAVAPLWRSLGQDVNQGHPGRGGLDGSLAYDRGCGDVFAVDLLVSVVIGVETRACQGSSSEEAALGSGVGEDVDIGVVGANGFRSGRSGNGACISTQLHFAGEDLLCAGFGFDEQDIVYRRAAELDSEGADIHLVHRWCGPRALHVDSAATEDDAAAVGSADADCYLLDGREDEDAYGAVEQGLGYFIRLGEDLFAELPPSCPDDRPFCFAQRWEA